MDRKDKKEKPNEKINRFIIECMFNKYFEEEKEEIVRGREVAPTERVVPVR